MKLGRKIIREKKPGSGTAHLPPTISYTMCSKNPKKNFPNYTEQNIKAHTSSGFQIQGCFAQHWSPPSRPATHALHQLRRTRVDLLGRIVGFVGDKKRPTVSMSFLIWTSIYIGYMEYFDFTWWLNCSKIWVVKICVKLSRRCNCIQIYRFLHLQLSKI